MSSDHISETSGRRRLGRFPRVVITIVVVLIALYLTLGALVAPPVLQKLLVSQVEELFGLRVSVQDIDFNPLSMTLRVEQLSLDDPEGGHLLGFGQLEAQLSVTSLTRRAVVLSRVDLENPDVWVELCADSSLNLAPLFTPNLLPADEADTSGSPPPRVAVDVFRVRGGQITLTDGRLVHPFRIEVDPLDITMRDFSTHAERSQAFEVSTGLENGGALTLSGSFDSIPPRITVAARIDALPLHTVWRYLQDDLGFVIQDGRLNVSGNAVVDLTVTPPHLQIDDTSIGVKGVHLVTAATSEDIARLQAFELSGLSVDLASRIVRAARVETRGADLVVLRNEKGEVESTQYFTLSERIGDLTAFARGAWQWELDELQLSEYRFAWVDRSVELEPQTLTVSVSVIEPSNQLDHVSPVEIRATGEAGGEVVVSGTAGLNPARVELTYQVDIPSVDVASVYLAENLPIEIRRGRLSVDGGFDLGQGESEAYANLQANVSCDDISLIQETEKAVSALSWEQLKVTDARLAIDPMDWSVDRVKIETPQALFRILPTPEATAALAEGGADSSGAMSARDSVAVAPDTTGARDVTYDPRRHIGLVELHDGSITFVDSSGSSEFRVAIEDLTVSVGGGAGPDGTTRVSVEGLVDGEAPILVTGHLDPQRPARSTEFSATLEDYDLTRAQAYSARYAGWTVKHGHLALDLRYAVESGYLDGTNRVELRDLDMGDKVESSDAPNLPLGMAVPLMKNDRGVIDVDVKVQGDLNDTSFNPGEIIVGELTGLVLKVVKTPFKLLGGLVGIKGDDLSVVTFEAGSDSLRSPEVAKLKGLETAMVERPEVKIEIEGRAFRAQDTRGLQSAWLEGKLLALWQADRRYQDYLEKHPEDDRARSSVPLSERERLVRELYEREVGSKPPGDDLDAARRALRESHPVEDDELMELARRRAEGVRAQLLASGQVSEERVTVEDVKVEAGKDQAIRVQLKIRD